MILSVHQIPAFLGYASGTAETRTEQTRVIELPQVFGSNPSKPDHQIARWLFRALKKASWEDEIDLD
jgi:hypothetical protein